LKQRRLDTIIVLLLLALPLLWFAPQVLGGKTLLPADNLYQYEPWASHKAELGVSAPYNPLISDLVLENYPWKSFLREAIHNGEIPLWNPRLFAGQPFLAAGQNSALYPLSLLFYVLPLWYAYGVFTWLQLGLAAVGVYLFARVLHQRPLAAALAAIAYAFSGFFIVSVNFTMIIAAAAWLPWILAMIELAARTATVEPGCVSVHPRPLTESPIPWVTLGAVLFCLQALAGHIEITYYVLMTSAFYAVWRLAGAWLHLTRCGLSPRARTDRVARTAGWLLVMTVLGMALGSVQLAPMYELVKENFRQGSVNLQQVLDWAWPKKQILTFVLPDFFGNPTHHSYFDIWRRTWTPVTVNALSEPLSKITGGAIDWGGKNYVEGANYLGLGTLLLAVIAVLAAGWEWLARRKDKSQPRSSGPATIGLPYIACFAVLAVLSLLFAFGTPLYAVLFYLAPGYNQLHSAFRWVFPYTLCMAMLAGFGLDLLLAGGLRPRLRRTILWLAGLTAAAGVLALAAVAFSMVVPGPFIAIGNKLLAASDMARQRAFANGAMAWSYEAVGLARAGLMALLTGVAVWWVAKAEPHPRPLSSEERGVSVDNAPAGAPSLLSGGSAGRALNAPSLLMGGGWGERFRALPLLAVLILDLWLFGHGFNPAADPKLLTYQPPVLQWLHGQLNQNDPWRMTTYDAPGDKLLNSNAGMVYGLEDVRGYDSMIPKPYVDYMGRIQTQGELIYNRIAPIYSSGAGQQSDALGSPLLNLLGVRYVLTQQTIVNPGYTLAYPTDHQPAAGETRVYANANALPRVFIAGQAVTAGDQKAALDALQKVDPRQTVVVEGLAAAPPAASPQLHEARISNYGLRQVMVDVNVSDRGWLVFTDSFFSGWKAYVRPFGAQGEGVDASGASVEQQVPLYRADGNFRAVYLDHAGQWTVRFVYSPRSVVLGLYLTFLAGMTLLLVAGAWVWNRYYRDARSEVGTAAKNSVVQVVMSLLNRVIDFAFAMLRLRVLGPAGEGSYANAINFYMVFDILTRFGLGTLLTRDVACDRTQARRYLINVTGLRVILWLVSLPIIFLSGLAYRAGGQMSIEEAQAIAIFAAALLFANVADAISSVFNAFEKMEYPAGLATATTVGKVALGALVLLPPLNFGFVGLAGVSLVMNVVQVVWLYAMLQSKVLNAENTAAQPAERQNRDARSLRARLDWPLQKRMFIESGPLMINNLLATVYWRISQFVLRYAAGAAALGIFSVGVKFIDALNVIPSYFTLAIFPLMSRYANAGNGSLVRAYRLAVQLLLIVALPIAVFATFAATPLVQIVGGTAFLPDSATVLAIMIWSIPIGFVNSVTQYVLIAVNKQGFLTRAFIIGVTFTGAANLYFVPRYGHIAAAIILIPAELSLFIPFAWAVHRYVAPMPWLSMTGRPLLAAAGNALVVWLCNRAGVPLIVGLTAGFAVYVALLWVLGAFHGDDFAVLRARLPKIGKRKVAPAA
jgi:O-antigen/teichoic acid export membrane protein